MEGSKILAIDLDRVSFYPNSGVSATWKLKVSDKVTQNKPVFYTSTQSKIITQACFSITEISNFLKILGFFSEENSSQVHYSSTPGMNLLQICFLQRRKATSQPFYISTASSTRQTTTQVLKMLFNMHLCARAQMTILKTEFLASQRSSTDSQCWVSNRVGARRMTL